MSITEIGRQGEKLAREILLTMGVDSIFQADWLVQKNEKWYVVEVKHKEIFKPPPFCGQGLNIRQVKTRMQFYKDTGIRCLFLVIDLYTGARYWQWLDVLEKSRYFDTRNGIRIYNIANFNSLSIPA